MRDLLTDEGITVTLTRPDDTGVGPCVDERAQLANDQDVDAFVGIHGDGASASSRGFHVIRADPPTTGPETAGATQRLAMAMRDALAGSGPIPVSNYLGVDGIDGRYDLAGLNLNERPAVYVECGNMRSAADAQIMSDPAGRQEIAAARIERRRRPGVVDAWPGRVGSS